MFWVVMFGLLLGGCFISCVDAEEIPVALSGDGTLVLKSTDMRQGLALANRITGKETLITETPGAGYYASLSADGKIVCFKMVLVDPDGSRLFAPALYQVASGKTIVLADPSCEAGTPSVSANGCVAFTVGKTLTVLDGKMKVLATAKLDHHVNLLTISADGSQIAYNNRKEQIVVLDLASGKRRTLTHGEGAFWGPQFSPAGDKILVSTVDGKLCAISLVSGKSVALGSGLSPAWVDNETVAFTRKQSDGIQVNKTELLLAKASGESLGSTMIHEGDAEVVVSGGLLAVSKDAKISCSRLSPDSGGGLLSAPVDVPTQAALLSIEPEQSPITLQSVVSITGVPYIHQAYDTTDTFCGSWACGATSALMTLTFYNLMDPWPCTCSTPYVHESLYGRYISETYTYNGFTFDIRSKDCASAWARGGYGYIVQNNWEDTKTHMAEYISYHGPSSYVDWAPTYAKIQNEVNNVNPFVLLNSLTSAGHYITIIGYHTTQYTVVCNDPYGNKNTPGYPSYDGTGAQYDWPGYNYGNQNLSIVHCYIYSRYNGGPTFTPTNTPDVYATSTPTNTPGGDVIVDNSDGGFSVVSGAWATGTSSTDKYGVDYSYNTCGVGADVVQWSASLATGTYKVYAWWPQGTNRATDAPYTIYYSGGSQTIDVNQQVNGGTWNLLGTYGFTAGSWSIRLSDDGIDGAKVVMADAVKWERVADPATSTPTNTPSSTPTNTPTVLTDTPTETPTDGGPTETPTDTPTEAGPTDTPTDAPTDTPTNTPTNTPIAITIDDGDAGYTKSGSWTTVTDGGTEPLNGDYDQTATTTGAATAWARWTPDIAAAGNYTVYVRYRVISRAAYDSPYTVYYNGGNQTIDVNQTVNGGTWVLLGTFNFSAGTGGYVQLDNGPAQKNKNVCADAVMFVAE